MLKIGSLHEDHGYSILDVAIFDGDKLWFEDYQKYECDELAQYFCDTRGIILVNEKDYAYLTTNFCHTSVTHVENQTRMYLTDKGYKLIL